MSSPTCMSLSYTYLSDLEDSILKYIYKNRLPTGVCYISYKLLSKTFGVSKKSIHKAVNSLVEKGLIKRVRKGYYILTDKAILYLETNREAEYPSTPSPSSLAKTSPLVFLLSGIIGFEVLERWAKQCFLFYRPHNIRIRIPLMQADNSLYGKKVSTPFGTIFVVDKANLEDDPYLVVEVVDHKLIPSNNLGKVVDYIFSLPYKIASWLERNFQIIVDYEKIVITHVALGVVVNPNEVPNDIVNKLIGWLYTLNLDAKKTLYLVDESVGCPEIEIETDDVNKLCEVLVLMFPLTLVEFIKKDLEIDEKILEEIREIKELLKEIKKG